MWPFDYFKKKTNYVVPDMNELTIQSNANNIHEGIPGITSDSELATKVKSFFIGIIAEPCKIIYHGFATGYYAAVNVFAPSKERKEAQNNHSKGFKDSLLLTCTFGISSLFKEKSDTAPTIPQSTSNNIHSDNNTTNENGANGMHGNYILNLAIEETTRARTQESTSQAPNKIDFDTIVELKNEIENFNNNSNNPTKQKSNLISNVRSFISRFNSKKNNQNHR